MIKRDQPQSIPICPKCGYDQSGEIATWESACPIEGTCPECGLEFEWADVFDPVLNDLSWYSEHAKSIWAMIWRTPRTCFRLAYPVRFWREVGVSKRVSPWRLLGWAIVCVVSVHLMVSIPNGIRAWNEQNWSGKNTFAGHYQSFGVYGVADLVFDGLAYPYFNAVPALAWNGPVLQIEHGWIGSWYQELWIPLGFQFGFVTLWLVVMFAIPQTRNLMQLRGAHIFRATVLSVLVMLLSFEVTRLNFAIYRVSGFGYYYFSWLNRMLVPVAVLWQLLFWGSAVAVGWRVKPWRLLVVLGSIAALLGGLALRIYIFLGSIS